MTRRGNGERIYAAQRAGVLARLTRNERVNEREAEQLVAHWEWQAEATGRRRGSLRYWDDGWAWIQEHRTLKADKTDMSAVGDDGQVFGG